MTGATTGPALGPAPLPDRPQAASAARPAGVVGPNAVIQVAAALRAAGGDALARRVFDAAGLSGLLDQPPARMVDEALVARLHRALAATLPPAEAEALAREAGRLTAGYVMVHRIPAAVRLLLRSLPARPAGSLLLRAIARHAWTFAGSGRVRTGAGRGLWWVEIAGNPIATPGCPWHCGVFEALFDRLVTPHPRVLATGCCARSAPACRFEIRPAPRP